MKLREIQLKEVIKVNSPIIFNCKQMNDDNDVVF